MDIKEQIESIVGKLKNDKNLLADFKKDPIKTVEKLLGIDLPDEALEKVVDGVKAKLGLDKVKDAAGALGALGGLFGKK